MKQIFDEIILIDQNLSDLQNVLAKIDLYKQQCEKDIASKMQKANLCYAQTIEQIEDKKKQVEATYAQTLASCRQKRKEAEIRSQTQYSNRERQIRGNCDAIVQDDKRIVSWIENAIAEMPSKLVKKIVSGPTITPSAVSKNELEDIYNKIFDDSFHAGVNRTFHIDGYLPKSKMIQKFLQKAIAYKLYLEDEIKVTTSRRSTEINSEYQRAQGQKQRDINHITMQEKNAGESRMRALQALDEQVADAQKTKMSTLESIEQIKKCYEKELTVRRNNFTAKYNSFISSTLVTHFTDRVRKTLVGTGAANADWISYDPNANYPQYSIGDFLLPIKATEPKLLSALQTQISNAFKAGFFRIPLLLNSNEASRFFINYLQYSKNAICEFVQGIILQKLRCAEAGNIEAYFAEPDKSGQILGPLSARIQENEAIGIYNINSKDSIKITLKKLASDIDVINGLLGNYHSIYEYNQSCKPHIKERCLILVDVGGVIDKEDWELLKVIWNNSSRCGVTIVIVSAYSISNIPSLYPHMNIDVSYLDSKEIYLVNCINQKCSMKHGQNEFGFIMGKMTNDRKAFVDLYREAANNFQKVDSRFASHFDAAKEYQYRDSTKELALPIMLRNYPGGGQFEFVMDSKTKAHTLLTGGTGSGKTTFLYMLISSIIMNYHPDDVELWLVDYGRVSFKKYVNKRPKHVRFISLEKTETFTYSFLEYVDEYFSNRARLFKNDNVDSLAAYRSLHGKLSMPRIVLIIDEFHVVPQHAKESATHNRILENILREYRKYGLSCIFSDQTCNTGLTPDGAKQIANRLAMRQNNIQDIIDTLDVAKSNYTEEKLRQMERTQQGEIWAKVFNGDSESDFEIECFKAIYASEYDQQQVLDTSLKRNDVVNCDPTVYIVDGEERAPLRLDGMSSALTKQYATEPTFCMGVPTSIEPFFSFELEQRYGNNVLVAGRNSKIGGDVLVEMLLSATLTKNVRTIVFADPREKKLTEIRNTLDEAFNTISHLRDRTDNTDFITCGNSLEVYSDYKSICGLIKEFSEQIKRREVFDNPAVILWLGMLDIYDELSVYNDYQEEVKSKQESFEVSDEKASKAVEDEELKAMSEQLGMSIDEMLKMLSQASEEVVTKPDAEAGCIYNAIADINMLLSMGGRYSLYSIVPLENASDIKRLKDFKLDNFIHKIGYAMSSEDSWDFGFGKKANAITDDDMALYTNGVKTHIFRPFLLK